MLPLATDADVHGAIVRGLFRRYPEIDLVRVQDALPDGTPDPDVLTWAATEGRILITQDESTMIGFAYARVEAGELMPGLVVRGNLGIGEAMEALERVALCGTAEDFRDQVRYLGDL